MTRISSISIHFFLLLAFVVSNENGFGFQTINPKKEKNGAENSFLKSGCYDLEAVYGKTKLPGILRIENLGNQIRGQMTLKLGFDLHIALRAVNVKEKQADFKTSSPVTKVTIELNEKKWTGKVVLTGNRVLKISGPLQKNSDLKADFQKPFALSPFAMGTISTPSKGQAFITFTPNGKQAYISEYSEDFTKHQILQSKLKNKEWTQPKVVSFSSKYSDRSPMLSIDGSHLFFASTRPLPGGKESGDYNLWTVKKGEDGKWLTPQPLKDLNSSKADYQPCQAKDGTLYFSSQRDGNQDLYSAKQRSDFSFEPPKKLKGHINTKGDEMGCFVDPNKRFILFTTSTPLPGAFGDDDLYISFPTESGWSRPRNLGSKVNSFANEYAPVVSSDGKFLYFASDRSPPANIYRVRISELGEKFLPPKRQ